MIYPCDNGYFKNLNEFISFDDFLYWKPDGHKPYEWKRSQSDLFFVFVSFSHAVNTKPSCPLTTMWIYLQRYSETSTGWHFYHRSTCDSTQSSLLRFIVHQDGVACRFIFTVCTTAPVVITSSCNPLKHSRLSRESVWSSNLKPAHLSGHHALFV